MRGILKSALQGDAGHGIGGFTQQMLGTRDPRVVNLIQNAVTEGLSEFLFE